MMQFMEAAKRAIATGSQTKLPEVESRTQGSRPRTQKNFEAKAEDRPSPGQGPRTQTQVFSEKKRSSKIFFRRSKRN